MINTTAAYKTAIRAPSRKIKAKLVLSDLTLEKVDRIELDSMLTDADDFRIGTANMDVVKIEISDDPLAPLGYSFDGKEIEVQLGIVLADSTKEYHSIGKYTVEKSDRKDSKIYLDLVDRMHKADKLYISDLTYPTTIEQILISAANQAGLTLATGSYANMNYIVNIKPVYEDITCRQVFAYVAELAGGYARINQAGSLVIMTLGALPSVSITGDQYIDWKKAESAPGVIDKVIVKNGTEEASAGSGVNIYTIVDNLFVQTPSSVATNIYNVLSAMNYKAGELNWIGDYSLEMGDKVTIDSETTYILNRKLKYTGGLREVLKVPGKSNIEKNSTGKPNTNLQINQIKTQIRIQDGIISQKIEDDDLAFSAITQELDSITQTVSGIEGEVAAITPHQVILDNENQSFPTDAAGKVTAQQVLETKIETFRGITRVTATIGAPVLKNSVGATIVFGTFVKVNPTATVPGSVIWTIPINTTVSGDSGWVEIPITIQGLVYTKKLSWTKAKIGAQGIQGVQGIQGTQGIQGLQGTAGTQGIQGPVGANGLNSYAHIAYSTSASGATGFSTSDPIGATYIGMYVDNVAADSNAPGAYNWTLIKGSDGAQGIQGLTGANGQTSYLHIAYATNAAGTTGFSTTDSVGKTYIGQYTDFVAADSSDYTKYSWTLIKGDQGIQGIQGPTGAQGKGISSTAITYQASSSGTVTPTGSWVASVPAVADNQFLWTRTIITYTDAATSTSYSVGKMGAAGPTGKGISSTVVTYQASASGTVAPTGTWSASVPAVADNQYLWTRVIITYSDATTTTSHSIGKMGAQGPQGTQGIQGVQGIQGATGLQGPKGDVGTGVSSVTEYYLASASASGVTTATAGWTTAMQSMTTTNKYLWNYEVISFTDGSTSPTIPVIIGVFGNTGSTGATGRALTGVVEKYLVSASVSGITRATAGWTTTMQVTTEALPYLWNYEELTWSVAPLTTYIEPIVIGVHGPKGNTGSTGSAGANAKLIDIVPSSTYFLSSSVGADPSAYVYAPTTITLEPKLQACVYSKWQYSLDGTTFNDVTVQNGLAINATTKVLTVSATSTLFSTTQNFIVFRVLSTTSESDTQTLTRVYQTDVLAGRVSSAEQKITPSAITSTVETNSTILATKSEVTQSSEALTLKFATTGGQNYIRNGKLLNGISEYSLYYSAPAGATLDVRQDSWVMYTPGLGLVVPTLGGVAVALNFISGLIVGKTYTAGCLLAGHRATNQLKVINYADTTEVGASNQANGKTGGVNIADWTVAKLTFVATDPIMRLRFNCTATSADGHLWAKEIRCNEGTELLPYSPHPSEIYDGIIKLNKDGINVGISASEITTQILYDGMQIKDAVNMLASFGSAGANVPKLQADTVSANNLITTVDGWGSVNCGTGYTYTTIAQALNAVMGKNVKNIRGKWPIYVNIYGTVQEDLELVGLTGDTVLVFNFANSAKFIGKIFIQNCTIPIFFQGQGGAKGLIQAPGWLETVVQVINSGWVYFEQMNLDGNNSANGFLADQGATINIHNCDMIRLGHAMRPQYGGTIISINNRGGGSGGPVQYSMYVYVGGIGYVIGTRPEASTAAFPVNLGWLHNGDQGGLASNFAPPTIVPQIFISTFGHLSIYTVAHDTASVDSYYGASAAQNRWDTSMGWKDGVFTFGSDIYNYWQGGYNVLVEMRVRRKNSTHGSSGGVAPAPYNFTPSEAFNAVARGAWTEWTTVPSSVFGSGGATLKFYNGVAGSSGYAIWDAAEVKVTVTKNV